MNKRPPKVQRRKEQFAQKVVTRICKEIPFSENPYLAERCLYHGFDSLELIRHRNYVDMIYLLMRGELPTFEQSKLLETLMVGLCNPGPRHPATRAAMNAGVGQTDTAHILPIALSIMGGDYLGGNEVQAAMRFIRRHIRSNPEVVVNDLMENSTPLNESDYHIAPGFGTHFGDVDIIPQRFVDILLKLNGAGEFLNWGSDFAYQLNKHSYGWLIPGVAAATFLDLKFHPRAGAGLFQLLCAPGLLAHGLEFANKPITAMPFVEEECYFIDETD